MSVKCVSGNQGKHFPLHLVGLSWRDRIILAYLIRKVVNTEKTAWERNGWWTGGQDWVIHSFQKWLSCRTMDLRESCSCFCHWELGERENAIAHPLPTAIPIHKRVAPSMSTEHPPANTQDKNKGTASTLCLTSNLTDKPLNEYFLIMARPSDYKWVGRAKEQYLLKSTYDAKAANSLTGQTVLPTHSGLN